MRALPVLALALGSAVAGLTAGVVAGQPGRGVAVDDVPAGGVTGGVAIAGGTLFDLAVSGSVVDRVAPCPSGAPCGALVLLVRSGEPAESRLLELVLDGEGPDRPGAVLREPVARIPADAESLAAVDLDGDGRPELLLGGPETIWSLGPADDPRPPVALAEGSVLDLPASRPLLLPAAPRLPRPGVGSLELWALQPSGRLGPSAAVRLPSSARRTAWGLEITSPTVSALDRGAVAPLYLVGPEELGAGRLRTLILEPGADDPAIESREAWAQLPGAESVASSGYALLDGRPVLVAFTHAADKVGVFDQKRLRVLPLSSDRTRAGAGPLLAVETTSHRWQRAVARFGDWNRDGRDDVAVAQVKGLGGDGILVELYLGKAVGGKEEGGFARKPRKTRVDAQVEGWRFADDVDGDGLPDLLVVDEDGRLAIYPSGGRERDEAIAETARWRLDLPALAGAEADAERVVEVSVGDGGSDVEITFGIGLPDVVDLDSDGRPELVFREELGRQAPGGGREALRVVRLER